MDHHRLLCPATDQSHRPTPPPQLVGLYPELAAFGFGKGCSPALQYKVARIIALSPSMEVARKGLQREGVVLVPASAVIEGPHGNPHVFAVAEDSIAARPVQVLGRSADTVAVKNIDAETLVVKHTYLGWAALPSGQKVEAVQ